MKFAKARTTPEATFDLTSMVDVVLLLIIFFMLTAQFAKTTASPMDLPREKGDASGERSPAAVVIEIGADGTLKVQDEVVQRDGLKQMIVADARKLKIKPEDLEVVIRADRACASGHLARLAEALASLGIKRWKLATTGGEA